MKEKEDKLKLVKQILVNDNEIDTKDRSESKETIQVQQGEVEMPTTSKIITTTSNTVPENTKTIKTTSTIKFEDSDTRPSRKVNTIISIVLKYICI